MPVGAFRIGKQNGAARPPVIGDLQAHCVVERHFLVADTIEARVNRIEAVGDVGEQQRRVVLEQRLKGVRQNFIRTVADEHFLWRNAIGTRDRLA